MERAGDPSVGFKYSIQYGMLQQCIYRLKSLRKYLDQLASGFCTPSRLFGFSSVKLTAPETSSCHPLYDRR